LANKVGSAVDNQNNNQQ
jgi:hypothetical protein